MPVEVARKLAVLGISAVGKSSMTTCLVEDRFVENYDPTIENTFHKTIQFRKFSFALDIVDTAGMVRKRVIHYCKYIYILIIIDRMNTLIFQGLLH